MSTFLFRLLLLTLWQSPSTSGRNPNSASVSCRRVIFHPFLCEDCWELHSWIYQFPPCVHSPAPRVLIIFYHSSLGRDLVLLRLILIYHQMILRGFQIHRGIMKDYTRIDPAAFFEHGQSKRPSCPQIPAKSENQNSTCGSTAVFPHFLIH